MSAAPDGSVAGSTRPAKRAEPLSLSRCCGPRRLSPGAVVDSSGSTSMPLQSQSISQPSMTGAPRRVASSCDVPWELSWLVQTDDVNIAEGSGTTNVREHQ